MLAAFLCGIDAILLVIGLNLSKDGSTTGGVIAMLAVGVSAYIALLFFVSVARLYIAHATYKKVSKHFSGTHQSS